MQVTDKVTLNLSGEELFAPIFARQGDLNSRIVEATLQFDEALYEIPENTKVVVTYRSANGKSDIHDGAVSGANTVTFPLIPLLLSAPGRARCDVELYNSGNMLGTGLLYVDVTPMAAKSGALETAPMYQTFVDAIADMTNKTADADEAINNANTAAGAASAAAQNAAEKATAAQAAADAANTATGAANTAAEAANTAAGSANSAATRATTAAEEAEKVIADVSGELGNIVDTQISGQKGQPNGLATLDAAGKLVQMPTAADVGSYTKAEIDARLAPVWVYPDLDPSVTDAGQWAYQTRYCKSGNVVTISGLLSTWQAGATIMTLPEGYRPERDLASVQEVATGSGSPVGYTVMAVYRDGAVALPYVQAGSGWIFLHCTFVTK